MNLHPDLSFVAMITHASFVVQAVMVLKGTIDYFVDNVFNYPTLAECYKAAAFNGLNKLSRF